MADFFGDPALFDEFDKPREPSDRILMKKFQQEASARGEKNTFETDEKDDSPPHHVRFNFSSSESSASSEDSDSENESNNEKNSQNKLKLPESKESTPELHGDDSAKHPGISSNGELQASNKNEDERLRATIEEIKIENSRLKRHSRLVDPNVYFKDEEGPAIQLLFMNHMLARKYKADIERFIAELLEMERNESQKDAKLLPIRLRSANVCLSDRVEDIADPDSLKRRQSNTVIGCSQVYRNFVVDNMGWPLVADTPGLTDGWEVPSYQQVYREPLPCDSDEEEDPRVIRKQNRSSCFNCGGSHHLSECKEPKDFKRIRENKMQFSQSNSTPLTLKSGVQQSRYHVDDERFAKFVAGTIGPELRNALGLKDSQLPPYIYQMRRLGYPPGHLKAAAKETSGISMFDKHGRELDPEGDCLEDGEVGETNVPKASYDAEMFIAYPGFNVDLPDGVIDEAHRLGMPYMNAASSLDAMRKHFASQTTPKSMKRGSSDANLDTSSSKRRKGEDLSVSMEISSDDEIQSPAGSGSVSRSGTPSLLELEEQRRLLMQQMASAEELSDTQDSDFVPPLPPTPIRPPLPDETPPATPQTPSEESQEEGGTPKAGKGLRRTVSGKSLSVQLSTPIHQAVAEQQEPLPDPSKFSAGVEDHIPFENLPNATGTFQNLRKVLDVVRTKIGKKFKKS